MEKQMNHWTGIDFQHGLYGLRELDQHLEECAECRGELERLKRERCRMAAEPEVPHEFLAAQRRKIYARMETPRHNPLVMRWVLSAAMLLMIAGLAFQQWRQRPPAISDEQLFSDLSSIEQSAEPKAIQPIHNLFEE
jgi:predicted anti-sigma-YlaC factor YlaD